MRSPLTFFCLLAVTLVQKADSQTLDPSGPLIPFDVLNAMTVEQRTAYANTFDRPADSQGSGSSQVESAPGYSGATGYNDNGYGSSSGLSADRSSSRGSSSGWTDNSYKSSQINIQKGPYAYGYDEGHKSARGYSDSLPQPYPQRIIGLHGLVFERRYSRAAGLINPITPESLAHLGYRQKKKDEVFVPPY